MPKTVSDCCSRALQRLSVLRAGETAVAADAEIARAALEAMVNGWLADGLEVVDAADPPAQLAIDDYALADAFPISEMHFEGVAAMLAVAIAEDFETPPRPVLARDASRAEQRLYAAFMPSMVAKLDRALNRLDNSFLWPGAGS